MFLSMSFVPLPVFVADSHHHSGITSNIADKNKLYCMANKESESGVRD